MAATLNDVISVMLRQTYELSTLVIGSLILNQLGAKLSSRGSIKFVIDIIDKKMELLGSWFIARLVVNLTKFVKKDYYTPFVPPPPSVTCCAIISTSFAAMTSK